MLISKLFYSQGMDSELFLLVKQNDAKAFEELYRRYWPALVNTAYKKLDSRQKAEAIVQNIFTDFYNRRSTIELPASLSDYLNQTLRLTILNEYRSDLLKVKYQQYLFFRAICKNDLANPADEKEMAFKINNTLAGLPVKCRRVFLLSRKEKLSNKEIAAAMNIKVSTVEKHISKALKTLKRQMA